METLNRDWGASSNMYALSHCYKFKSEFPISSLTMETFESLDQWWSTQTDDVASVLFEVRPPYVHRTSTCMS